MAFGKPTEVNYSKDLPSKHPKLTPLECLRSLQKPNKLWRPFWEPKTPTSWQKQEQWKGLVWLIWPKNHRKPPKNKIGKPHKVIGKPHWQTGKPLENQKKQHPKLGGEKPKNAKTLRGTSQRKRSGLQRPFPGFSGRKKTLKKPQKQLRRGWFCFMLDQILGDVLDMLKMFCSQHLQEPL